MLVINVVFSQDVSCHNCLLLLKTELRSKQLSDFRLCINRINSVLNE